MSLPLTASKIHNVLNRAHDTVLDDLGDFITFRANYSSSDLKTGDYVPPSTGTFHGSARGARDFDQPDHVFIPADYATPGKISRPDSWRDSGNQKSILQTPQASTDVSRASIIPLVFEIELKGMN